MMQILSLYYISCPDTYPVQIHILSVIHTLTARDTYISCPDTLSETYIVRDTNPVRETYPVRDTISV